MMKSISPKIFGKFRKKRLFFGILAGVVFSILSAIWFIGTSEKNENLSSNHKLVPSITKAKRLHHQSNRRPASVEYQIVDSGDEEISIEPHYNQDGVDQGIVSAFLQTYESLEMYSDDFGKFHGFYENGVLSPFFGSMDAWLSYVGPGAEETLGEVEVFSRFTVVSGTVDPTKIYRIQAKTGEYSYGYLGSYTDPTTGAVKYYSLRFTNIDEESMFGFIESYKENLQTEGYSANIKQLKNLILPKAYAGAIPQGLDPRIVDEINKLGGNVKLGVIGASQIMSGCLSGALTGLGKGVIGFLTGLWGTLKMASKVPSAPIRAILAVGKSFVKDGVVQTYRNFGKVAVETAAAVKFFVAHGATIVKTVINDQIDTFKDEWAEKDVGEKSHLVCSWVGQVLFEMLLTKGAAKIKAVACENKYTEALQRSENIIENVKNPTISSHHISPYVPKIGARIPGSFELAKKGEDALRGVAEWVLADFSDAYSLAYRIAQEAAEVAVKGKIPRVVFPGRSLPLVAAILEAEFEMDIIMVPASATYKYLPKIEGSAKVSNPLPTTAMFHKRGGFNVLSSVFERFVKNELSGGNVVPIVVDYSRDTGGHGIYGFTAALGDWLAISKNCNKASMEVIHITDTAEVAGKAATISTQRGLRAPLTSFNIVERSWRPGNHLGPHLKDQSYNAYAPVKEFNWAEVAKQGEGYMSTADRLGGFNSANYIKLRSAVIEALQTAKDSLQ